MLYDKQGLLRRKKLISLGLFIFFYLVSGSAFAAVPSVVAVIPAAGVSLPNQTVAFTTIYSDSSPKGYKDLSSVYFLISDRIGNPKSFSAYYSVSSNKFYLKGDDGKTWLGGYAPRSGKVIENSFVRLNCSASRVSGLARILIVRWSITFKPSFTGKQDLYLFAQDKAGRNTGWIKKGNWRIGTPPVINSVTPASGSTFLAGAKINLKINASDRDKDALSYQFFIGGKLIQDWSSSNSYSWQTSSADTGSVEITCNVKDVYGATATRTITLHIINPTIQDILQKVADNYAKIYDLKADMVLSSTLNGKPFGATAYCRYYFKAPNKEKTETFSNATRAIKTDAVIMSGSNMYLIDPVNRTTQQVDLLSETNITEDQFRQTDLYYNQSSFINSHTLTVNYTDSDLGNFIVALDAVPKTQNNIYTKLELCVDYNKGIVSQIAYYKNDELPQVMQAQETKQMPNGAWAVSKLRKIPNLKAGNLVITLGYTHIQINSSLPDSVFDPAKQY